MDLKKMLGFGIAIWVLMFAIISALIAFKLYSNDGSVVMGIVVAVIAGVVSYILAGYAKPKDSSQALIFGVSWAVVGLILDYFVTKQFNATIFGMWTLWLGYALVVLTPLLNVKKS